MRSYVVQAGDTPARIASRDEMAGCPRCSIELVRANPHKRTVVHPNGFRTFESLVPDEVLNLPDAWFDPARDQLPSAYYHLLPHHDGRTLGSLGGVLGDFPELDQAVSKVGALAAMGDAEFAAAAAAAGAAVDAAVREVDQAKSPDAAFKARVVRDSTRWAAARARELQAAVATGDQAAVTRARLDVQSALSTALGNARLAILAFYPSANPLSAPPELLAAAKAAAAAIAADPNYCTSVTHPGTPVNAAVHRFKLAWNASQAAKVPIGTSNYEVATVVALGQVLGAAPSACGAGGRPVPAPKPPPPLTMKQREQLAAPDKGWSFGKVALVSLLSATAIVGGIAAATAVARAQPARSSSRRYT